MNINRHTVYKFLLLNKTQVIKNRIIYSLLIKNRSVKQKYIVNTHKIELHT